MTARAALLDRVASLVPAESGDDCVRVGIDGADGAGKTTFASELAEVLRTRHRPVIRISVDDFHRPRVERYRLGPDSPDGFWLDSFDYRRLWDDVLCPLGPQGSRWYRHAAHDLASDAPLAPPARRADPATVVVTDGLFLHRVELSGAWEFSVFLDPSVDARVHRLAERDGTPNDPTHPRLRRYLDAHRRYVEERDPAARADLVVDNTDLDAPVIVTVP